MRTRRSCYIERAVIYSIIVILLLGNIIGLYLLYAKYKNIDAKKREFEDKRDKLIREAKDTRDKTKKELKPKRQQSLQAQRKKQLEKERWKDQHAETEKFLKIVPFENEKPRLMDLVYTAARKLEIIVFQCNTKPLFDAMEFKGIKIFKFEIGLEGKYKQIKQMLWELENLPIVVRVEEKGFTLKELNNEKGNMEVILKCFTYFYAK